MMLRLCMIMFVVLLVSTPAWAKEIYLTNGDRYSGFVVSEDEKSLVLRTMAAGEVTLSKAFIDWPKTDPENYKQPGSAEESAASLPEKPEVEWKKTLSLGYSLSGGNTQKSQLLASAFLNRKTKFDENTFKYDAFHSSANEKEDARKYNAMVRHAKSNRYNPKWYTFYKIEGNQDRFADIDYRIIPSVGKGYWFSDTEDWKLMTEMGLGYQYTRFRASDKSEGEPILLPRLFLEKRLLENVRFTQDLTAYPSLKELGEYRLRSETTLLNQLNKHWAWKIQFIDDYNSNPRGDVKKNDYTLISGLDYKF